MTKEKKKTIISILLAIVSTLLILAGIGSYIYLFIIGSMALYLFVLDMICSVLLIAWIWTSYITVIRNMHEEEK